MDNAGAVKKKSFVVSDIHAYYSALYQTLTDNEFFEDGSNRLILLGDALDRANGGYDPYWRQAEREAWRRARWSNGMLMHRNGCVVRGKTVVVGHYHTSFGHALLDKRGSEWGMDAVFTPYRAQGIIAIDACTAYTGKVNCLVFEGTQEISAPEDGKE